MASNFEGSGERGEGRGERLEDGDVGSEGRGLDVAAGLGGGLGIDVDAHDVSLGKALGHHQGNEARACAHVEDMAAAMGPGTEQGAVGAHLHGAVLLPDGELLELEIIVSHNVLQMYLLFVAWPKEKRGDF